MVFVGSLLVSSCKTQIRMPDEMPADIEIIFSDHLEHKTFVISRDALTFKSGTGWHNRSVRSVALPDGNAEKIYSTLRQNYFDKLNNDAGHTDERVNNSISVISTKFRLTIHQGLLPLSTEDNERFENIRRSILTLAEEYRDRE